MRHRTLLAVFQIAGLTALAQVWPTASFSADPSFIDVPPANISSAAKSPELSMGDLIGRLQEATGSLLAVELKSGETLNRATLLRISFDAKKKLLLSLTVQDATQRTRTVGFAAVRSLILDRERIYEAPLEQIKTSTDVRAQKMAVQETEERQQWILRAQKNGVKPWPVLTKAQHEAAIGELKQFVAKIQKAAPEMELYETQEFMFLTNLPEQHVKPFTTALDAMHDLMCTMYGLKSGEPVWRGKCLVVAFVTRDQFMEFEKTMMNNTAPGGAQGLCHLLPQGRVVVSCYTGTDPQFFGCLLVHETTHGFNYRYRTPTRLPSWVNEGMADSIARRLVASCTDVQSREAHAIQKLRQAHTMGGDFLTRQGNIDGWQYGIASSLTDFLIDADPGAYRTFIQGIKEGLTWEDSLKAAYDRTPEQMIAAYGESIGVPDLAP